MAAAMSSITTPTTQSLKFKALPPRSWLLTLRKFSSTSLASLSPPPPPPPHQQQEQEENDPKPTKTTIQYYPKRGQTIELVCESLAFKGKGVCKVAETGFVVMCDRALPGEKFLARVTRRKGSYAEATKLKTLLPHKEAVDAPCEYASYCGGCKTQNLTYEAQLRFKEQQVRELMIHVGKFSNKFPEFAEVMKPIVPCSNQFNYRNKMEFSFSNRKWVPKELLGAVNDFGNDYALGLHAPGFFDKVLNVDKCLLQSEPANAVLLAVQDCWKDPKLSLSPYDVHSHAGFLKHLVIRSGRFAVTISGLTDQVQETDVANILNNKQ